MSDETAEVLLNLRLPKYFTSIVSFSDKRGKACAMTLWISIVDGDPRIHRHEWIGEPPPPSELNDIDWEALAWQAVRMTWLKLNGTADDDGRGLVRLAKVSLQPKKRNRLKPDDLRRVLELSETEGVEAVAREFVVSRRQADRYIAKARAEAEAAS